MEGNLLVGRKKMEESALCFKNEDFFVKSTNNVNLDGICLSQWKLSSGFVCVNDIITNLKGSQCNYP